MKKPSKAPEDIGAELATLALKIASEANKDGVHLADRIESFKVLTTYYVNTTKVKAKQTPDEDEESSFDGFAKRIAVASGGA